MRARTFFLELVLELVSLAVLAGAGLIGDSIGTTTTPSITTTGTTRRAGRFTTAARSIEAAGHAATLAQRRHREAWLAGPEAQGCLTVLVQRQGLSRATDRPLEATLRPAVKAELARAPSAITIMAESHGATHRVGVPASAAERAVVAEASTAVVEDTVAAGTVNRIFSQCSG